jgi:hypothetical protein
VLFRPEEVHGASCIGHILKPFPERNSHVAHQTLRFSPTDDPVTDFYPKGETAIQAGGIDPDCFSRKEPADRQRLKPSLAKPLLLSIDGNSVLGREIVERGK